MKIVKILLTVGCLILFVPQLFAQRRAIIPVERSQGSRPQSFYVNVSVDHENHVYESGDLMKVTVESSKAGYLYLLYKDARGNVTLLFPNSYHSANRIEGNKKEVIPSANMEFDLKTMPPFGKETLQAIVTLKPIEESSLTNFRDGQTFNVLSSRQLRDLREEAARAIGVVGRNREERGENDLADCVLDITTVPKGQVPQTRKKRYFVGICVAKYSDRRIPELPACEKDMEAMIRFFNASSAIDADESRVYINERATKEKIKDLFYNYLPNHTKPGDEILVYWTGHGGRCSDTSGDERDGYDETLILYDSKHDDPETQLIDDDFGRWVQNLSGRKVLFILDTCHSSGMANRAKGLHSSSDWDSDWNFGFNECATVKDIGQSNLALIASCAKNEVSLVRDEQDMSVMTWYILEHLKRDSGINHHQLYRKIKPQVYHYVKKMYQIEQNVSIQDDFDSPMILNP
ncbi:MAG: DUF4384 domain-containing protein [Thermoguttaceae bacterium]|nr:DUF4384 domain-containing protein [Thermoguttaceae bacterium]